MLLAVATVFVFLGAYFLNRSSRTRKLPPGPKPDFIIGHANQLPSTHAWLWYTQLKGLYGDVVHLSAFGKHIIVLNSYKVVNELFSKRAALYSDRPTFPMAGELMHQDQNMALAHYGPGWRQQRRLFHQHLSKASVLREYTETIEGEIHGFVGRIHDHPNKVSDEFRLSAVRLIVGVTYGLKIETVNDPYVERNETFNKASNIALAPGAFLVDLLPILMYVPAWFPGAGWKRFGQKWGGYLDDLIDSPFQQVKRDLAAGTAVPSFTSQMLSATDESDALSEHNIKWLSGTMYSAGADTTWTAVMRFFLVMTLYPDIQRKAQEEIDRVVGTHRLPNISDKENLPYLDAVMKELFRWEMMTPIGVPHSLVEDDEYEGMHLPKGSTIIANSWAISRDSEMFPEADRFNPERYLTPNPPLDSQSIVFGYGRRICPGMHFAQVVVWNTMANVLATTNILKPLDANGKLTEPIVEFSGEILAQPHAFDYRLEVRSPALLAMARSAN